MQLVSTGTRSPCKQMTDKRLPLILTFECCDVASVAAIPTYRTDEETRAMTYLLLALVLLLSILCLYLLMRSNAMRDYPPKPDEGSTKPPRPEPVPVEIMVVRNEKGEPIDLRIDPPVLVLAEDQQAKWSTQDGRLEIRFSAKLTPFTGDIYETARGGESFSGAPLPTESQKKRGGESFSIAPLPSRPERPSFEYTVFVTTSDGFFLSKKAEVRIVGKKESKY